MPYINPDSRSFVDAHGPRTPGELNYAITKLLVGYLKWHKLYPQPTVDNVDWHPLPTYQDINDIIGAVEAAKLEFMRRVVNPYEDTKIKENGDCY
jgi:hypothetical protein